jgi:hypothetical protein
MASKIVDFPEPVGPIIAKIPSFTNSLELKSISHSPYSEFRLEKRNPRILTIAPPEERRESSHTK